MKTETYPLDIKITNATQTKRMTSTTTETEQPKPKLVAGSLDWALDKLCEQLRKRGADAQRRIMAHIRERTGKNLPLPALHKDTTVSDGTKQSLYKECLAALVHGNYDALAGNVGQGDKTVEVELEAPATETKRAVQPAKAEPPTTTDRVVKPGPKMPPTVQHPVEPVKIVVDAEPLPKLDPVTSAMLTTMRPHIERIIDERIIDERIIDERIAHGMGNGAFPTERVKELVGAMLQDAVRPSHITPEILAALQSLLTAIQHSLNPTPAK